MSSDRETVAPNVPGASPSVPASPAAAAATAAAAAAAAAAARRAHRGPAPRVPLSRENAPRRACGPDAEIELNAQLQGIWDLTVEESKASATRMRALAPLWADRDHASAPVHAGEVEDAEAAVVLRCTISAAYAQVRDAHEALTLFPRLFARLEAGDLPVEWLRRVLRRTRDLPVEDRREIDRVMAGWEFGVTPETFRRLLGELVCLFTSRLETSPLEQAERRRHVSTPAVGDDGSASVTITGPIPEITAFMHRLDACAETLQRAQRHALDQDGVEIPFDDGTVRERGRAMSKGSLRYEALRHGELNTDGHPVPAPRFTILVTVPALTLMGRSDAPATLEDIHPIPADMARELAAGEKDWMRVLTDPAAGTYLPLPPERYQPTPAMQMHLRLRGPECAVPGCTRPSCRSAEADHIEEFDHQHPEAGGSTSLENLHLLCWSHHQIKTSRAIDPDRLRAAEGGAGPPGSTRWSLREDMRLTRQDETDLLTPSLAGELHNAWQRHLTPVRTAPPDPGSTAQEDHSEAPPPF
ncbi:HNH endonuclease [Brachybacterium endophyticum]|uniref:HNH endonuclease n=1 Tax=Brachybacterium endophyticum TaxID=2182385 RepID=A0A2U2RP94_9MICO|nr:HNH endonuclease signature motif containing protein [Brachybacterium endophyticum]PWH07676.1 HNH endonuclease [Brachybacterium endophyticum]